jgi:hypothetical protein
MDDTFYSNILKLTEENSNNNNSQTDDNTDPRFILLMRCYIDILEFDIKNEMMNSALKGLRTTNVTCMNSFCDVSVYDLLNKKINNSKSGFEQLKDRFGKFNLNLITEDKNPYVYTGNIKVSYTYGSYSYIAPKDINIPINEKQCSINISW